MIIISEKDVIEESFNPTLVRLRLRDHLSQHDPDRRFNPTLVRLRPVGGGGGPGEGALVSIPRWFD